MNKSERLNDMMLFLNDKNLFNLKDLMDKYSISKSTAIRDIQALESIGMPIYSQSGRNGYYGILQNRLLSPIVFTVDEVFAMYFSMLTLGAYETTPFHLSIEKLKNKFENCLSTEKVKMLHRIEKIFSLGAIQHNNYSYFLKDILQFAMEERVCEIKYSKKGIENRYIVQIFDISSVYGQWYATGYNFETDSTQVFRCDKVLDVKESTKYEAKPFMEFVKTADMLYKAPDATDFEIEISKQGVDLFYKEHYPSMKLYIDEERNFIRGFYNKGEEEFIATYLIGYGQNILFIQPIKLKELMIKKMDILKKHLLSISDLNISS
ncbi:helix-turn-helix transcriptional regulator [Clostridium drakei]|nr:YafY family protein [Clostridium drakei]